MNVVRMGAIALASALLPVGSIAAPVTITTPFMDLENRGINSLGFSTGEFLRIGANSVVPNASAGTTGFGTTTNLLTLQPVAHGIGFVPSPLLPDFFQALIPDNPALYGPWKLTFTNGPDSSSTLVSLPAGAKQVPFVNSITLSGTSLNPTFSWTAPPGTVVNGYRLNIYDKSLINTNPNGGPINSGQVASVNVKPSVTSFTVLPTDFTVPGYGFQSDHNYSIEINALQTKDGTSNNLGNANLEAISRVYADFRTNQTGGPAVNLPVTLANGSYQFNITVVAGQTYYIDPSVATGYDYRTGVGDPNFKSVLLPTGIGDGLFDIYGVGPANQSVLLAHDWRGGTSFSFGASGLDEFRVEGIEPSAGLDPSNVTAFVTGLTFESDGAFTGTQTPLVAPVPEPETYLLMFAGLVTIGLSTRKKVQRRSPRSMPYRSIS